MSVILQPCGSSDARQHFVDTIARQVSLRQHADLLTSIAPELIRLFPSGHSSVWGVTPGQKGQNEKKFNCAVEGDVVLFAKQGHLINSAVVALKFHSAKLARALWGEDHRGLTWEFIYFLDEVKPIKITYGEFNAVVGYQPNFIVRGFSVLDEEKSERVLEHFGFLSGKHYPPTTRKDFESAVDQLAKMKETERKVQSYARKEQAFLRRNLFKTSTHNCAICGKEYPIDVLSAAHIKRRSACSKFEKLDANNIVMGACRIGCDELYESGYISVGEAGKIITTQQKTTPPLKEFLESIKNRACAAFKDSNAGYFAWHRKTVFRG